MHLFRHQYEISDIHGLKLGFVEAISHSNQECSFQYRQVLIREVPVCRNFRPIRTPESNHKRLSFGVWVSFHYRDVASLDDRRPLQIAEVHNFGRCGAVFFLLAINRRRKRGRAHQRDTHTSHSKPFHQTLLFQKDRTLNWPKDTPPPARLARHVNLHGTDRALFQQRLAPYWQPLMSAANKTRREGTFEVSLRGA